MRFPRRNTPETGHSLADVRFAADDVRYTPNSGGFERKFVEKHGVFAALLKHLERRHGSALPTPHLDTVDDHMMSPLWLSQPDQRPPQVFHGHENKRHR